MDDACRQRGCRWRHCHVSVPGMEGGRDGTAQWFLPNATFGHGLFHGYPFVQHGLSLLLVTSLVVEAAATHVHTRTQARQVGCALLATRVRECVWERALLLDTTTATRRVSSYIPW